METIKMIAEKEFKDIEAEKEFESIETEVWNNYDDNPLPRNIDVVKKAVMTPDNAHYGKKLALAFVDCIDVGYYDRGTFAEAGYVLDADGFLYFEDGSRLQCKENGDIYIFDYK